MARRPPRPPRPPRRATFALPAARRAASPPEPRAGLPAAPRPGLPPDLPDFRDPPQPGSAPQPRSRSVSPGESRGETGDETPPAGGIPVFTPNAYRRTRRTGRSRSRRTPPWWAAGGRALGESWDAVGRSLPPAGRLSPTRSRLVAVWAVLMLAIAGLAARLVVLQVFQAETLSRRARAQQQVRVPVFVPRRPIVDRQGNLLAMDRLTYTLYAHPKLFDRPPQEIATALAPELDRSAARLLLAFDRAESGIRLADELPEDAADRVRALGLNGLELVQRSSRVYPQQDLMAAVLGYTNIDGQGQAGLEFSQEPLLERDGDTIDLSRTAVGLVPAAATTGSHALGLLPHPDDLQLKLALDSRLQRVARQAVREQMAASGAKRGAVAVMDAHTGALRALASEPTYDPNRYGETPVERFRNWVVTDLYEPGSTFKPLTVAIALESGAIGPDDIFNDTGAIRIYDHTITNSDYRQVGPRGPIDLAEIIRTSSNVGTVRIAQKMDAGEHYRWLRRLGLGDKSHTDLPFETASQIRDREAFVSVPVESATAAFGQGISVTPLQMLRMLGSLANGGLLVTPHVVSGLETPDGETYWTPHRPQPERIFSPETAEAVLRMMETVVESGTGQRAQVPGYRIAGKTGTSQKIGADGRYSSARIASFASIFPADDPQFVLLAVFDEPPGGYGGTVAAPAAKTVMEAAIAIDQIPPSAPVAPSE